MLRAITDACELAIACEAARLYHAELRVRTSESAATLVSAAVCVAMTARAHPDASNPEWRATAESVGYFLEGWKMAIATRYPSLGVFLPANLQPYRTPAGDCFRYLIRD